MTDEQVSTASQLPSLTPEPPDQPTLALPDPEQPDPPVLSLPLPASDLLDQLPIHLPDPPVPSLLEPILTANLSHPPANTHIADPVTVAPVLGAVPATLALDIAARVQRSADAQLLPANLHYDETRTTQEHMTHRLRHLAPLLLALSAENMPQAEREVPYVD
ncbi:hypothetical protein [Thermogemmatispora sp.]|uniref:hypothetical protein n=1 Tax=Thermogemmatispora sp. TaxID=1968838 RepID=UPI0035E42587